MQTFMKPIIARLAAAAATALALAGCSTERSPLSGMDTDAPSIAISIVGNPDTVDINGTLKVVVDAADNLSLKNVYIFANGDSVKVVRFTSATPRYRDTVEVSLSGMAGNQQVQINGAAEDGNQNVSFSQPRYVVVYDASAPTVSVSAPASGTTYRAGDPIAITVTASDPSGLALMGFQIFQTSQTGAITVLQADSIAYATPQSPLTRTFNTSVLSSLAPGQYELRGFARDFSAHLGVSSPSVYINVLDAIDPGLDFLSPQPDSNVTIQSDITAEVRLTDNVGLRRLSIVGIMTFGDPDLGRVDTVIKFDSVFAPVNTGSPPTTPASFRAGLRDTTIRRLMKPKNAQDTTTGPLYLVARVTDVAGNDSTVIRRVMLVSGPKIDVLRPGAGAVASPGKSIVVELRASDQDGVRTLGYNVTGAFTATRQAPNPAQPPDTLFFVDTLLVPNGIPLTSFTITPFATDNLGQPGSGPSVVVQVLSPTTDNSGPIVYQTLRTRVESDDSVTIRGIDPSGIQLVGYKLIQESTGNLIAQRDSVIGGSFTDVIINMPLSVPQVYVGQKIIIVSHAQDASTAGNWGYSVPTGLTSSQSDSTRAKRDTALVVYGRTFSLPQGGAAADLAVDTLRNRVFISNMTFDRLDVWEGGTERFASRKVAVGADPWGLFVDNSQDTLLVANSAGTNVSRVFIGSSDINAITEIAGRRIKTPNTVVVDLSVAIDANSGRARLTVDSIFDFSDRPQFVAQSISNNIYFSTKPTPSAEDGTLRHYDPNWPVPETQVLWQYGAYGNSGHVAILNHDHVSIKPGITPSISDTIQVCDHSYGLGMPADGFGGQYFCARSHDPFMAVDSLYAQAARVGHVVDIVALGEFDVKSLGLTDTTFVGAGGDRRWIAFGEGNTARAGRVMSVKDPEHIFSDGQAVADLVGNASEKVFGLAINSNSTVGGVRGFEAYFFELDPPLQMRLQGKVNTFDTGAGVAFHPDHTGDASPADVRVAFVASANGTIEIVDSFHYTSRGTLPVRANLFGPIRVTHRFPSDDPSVVLKLFGLTTEGLIVIDIRASDILPLP